MNYRYLDTPIGPLMLAGDDSAVRYIGFAKDGRAQSAEAGWTQASTGPIEETARQLREYFAGRRTTFDLPLAPEGTEFQKRVWSRLAEIPYGETISYGELAARVGNSRASRAVGAANGRNPLPIVIPCHRVIGANGKLTGFGGGLPVKETLLALEKKTLRGDGAFAGR